MLWNSSWTSLMGGSLRALCMIAAGWVAGCLALPEFTPLEPAPPVLRTHEKHHAISGQLVRRWSQIQRVDGPPIPHGSDHAWYSDGVRKYEREFDQGREVGHWRSWYEDGRLRSDYTHRAGELTYQRFFHPNGRLSTVGPARAGVREGEWTFYYEGGSVRKRGIYRGGEFHGPWELRYENGGLKSRGRYANGERVGEWQHYKELPPVLEAD